MGDAGEPLVEVEILVGPAAIREVYRAPADANEPVALWEESRQCRGRVAPSMPWLLVAVVAALTALLAAWLVGW